MRNLSLPKTQLYSFVSQYTNQKILLAQIVHHQKKQSKTLIFNRTRLVQSRQETSKWMKAFSKYQVSVIPICLFDLVSRIACLLRVSY